MNYFRDTYDTTGDTYDTTGSTGQPRLDNFCINQGVLYKKYKIMNL